VHTHKLCRLFVLLLCIMMILGSTVFGTVAYVAAATPSVNNTFVFDPFVFPFEPIPTPTPVPTPPPVIDLPETGDHSSLALWSALLALSAGSLLVLRRRRA